MSKYQKKEIANVAFNRFARFKENDGELIEVLPEQGLTNLKAQLEGYKALDHKDEKIFAALRTGKYVEINSVEFLNNTTLFGSFMGAYSGHVVKNSKVGVITADSINFRPFFFLIHRDKDGNLIVGVQYLGPFGDFTGLRNLILKLLPSSKNIRIRPIVSDLGHADLSNISKVEIELRNNAKNAFDNGFGNAASAFVLKREASDPQFTQTAQTLFTKILALADPLDQRKELAKIVNKHPSFDVDEGDILDCSLLATVNKSTVTIRVFEEGFRASRHQMEVSYHPAGAEWEGHPQGNDCKKAMWKLLIEKVFGHKGAK